MGNGAKVASLEIGDYNLSLPSGLVFNLKDCYYVPAMSRNIISVSCLDMDGFSFIIKNNVMTIHFKDIFYSNALLSNGLYVLDLENHKPIYNIDTNRVKSNKLNPTYF